MQKKKEKYENKGKATKRNKYKLYLSTAKN
jgi:hypothetical protein